MLTEVPPFRGTRRQELKFTPSEQEAIREAELEQDYLQEEEVSLGRLLGRAGALLLLWLLSEYLG